MSRVGRWCALAGVTLGVVTLATWTQGNSQSTDTDLTETTTKLSGEQLFHMKGCATCHLGPDSSPFLDGFPPLDEVPIWAATRRPGLTAEEYLAESMRTPGEFISPAFDSAVGATPGMPTLSLTPDDIDALIDYLLHR